MMFDYKIMSQAFMWLLFAHFIADWFFQNDLMAENKGKFWQIMLVHCMVYTGICTLAFKLIFPNIGNIIIFYALIIFISHWCIDKWKCNSGCTKENFPTWHLYVDQGNHILILWLIALWNY